MKPPKGLVQWLKLKARHTSHTIAHWERMGAGPCSGTFDLSRDACAELAYLTYLIAVLTSKIPENLELPLFSGEENAKTENTPKKASKLESDPLKTTIERVQAHACTVFGYTRGLYNPKGNVIGVGTRGRYGSIRRALDEWGFTEQQLCAALTAANSEAFYVQRNIVDVVNIFTKASSIDNLLAAAKPKLFQYQGESEGATF